ncbi:MAG TPA: carbonate dehydratase [Longimicrobiales bacterium]|nr:carbonate dehydratase [Longimicrobiales bacterium]
MKHLPELFAKNRAWAKSRAEADPEYFRELAREQNPGYLWIGCADSRVPANEIVGLPPGELFVHRNVANIVVHTDLNCLSVLEFAVQVLNVPHIIVCGHYGCGGVAAAWRRHPVGLVDNWLRHVEDVASHYEEELAALGDEARVLDRLCELNALEQALNVCRTSVVQAAWRRGQSLTVHGWIYSLEDGLLQDLGFSVAGPDGLDGAFRAAVTRS